MSETKQPQQAEVNHGKTVLRSLGIVFGMFAFGFALVPLYDVICEVTGLNGKTGSQYQVSGVEQVDETRLVTVQFTANNNAGMPWQFKPTVHSMQVHPGQQYEATFYAKNPTDKPMAAQAVPSMAPGGLAAYFHKTECFCFEQQILAPGEEVEMPLRFIVDKEIPARASKLTLSYTLFDLPEADLTKAATELAAN